MTRPETAANRFAEQFRARFGSDWPVVTSPLMRTLWLSPRLCLDDIENVIFTSETAVRAFARLENRRSLHAWCVGERTAGAARTAGFSVTVGPGDADALTDMILSVRPTAHFIWPHGVDTAFDVAGTLNAGGAKTDSVAVYEQIALPLTDKASALLSGHHPLLVPLFSTRSAVLFAEAARTCTAPLLIAAIGAPAAQKAATLNPEKCVIAARPDSESLLDALDQLAHPASTG